jgi:hypothetical protein
MLGAKYVPLFDVLCPGKDETERVRAICFSSTAARLATFFAGDESLSLAEKVGIT